MRIAVASALVLLAACQTLPAIVVTGGESFAVRYDPARQSAGDADRRAAEHCGSANVDFMSEETRFDGFAYRTYRCAGR